MHEGGNLVTYKNNIMKTTRHAKGPIATVRISEEKDIAAELYLKYT